jgi:hypothetical protein
MAFLQQFNPAWEKGFSARSNSQQAERFRATLACAALSRAFEQDLRPEFRELRFPIDDEVYKELIAVKKGVLAEQDASAGADKPHR